MKKVTTISEISLFFLKVCYTPPSPRQSNIWVSVDSMRVARVYHTATHITQDNSVLLTGGAYSTVITATVDKYIPATGCFQPMRDMPRPRYMHSADQLLSLSGYVVIAGGVSAASAIVGVADLYHPVTGDIVTISLSSARYGHRSAVLSSSQLVLIGGYNSLGAIAGTGDTLNIAANSVFVASSNTMNEGHIYHVVTSLGNNSDLVLITGGSTGAILLASTYLYHGSSNTFLPLGSGVTLSSARYYHAETYLPSPFNKVIITGGLGSIVNGIILLFDANSLTISNTTHSLITPRYCHTSTLLPNGKILITGGIYTTVVNTCELIDPSNNYTVTSAASLVTARYLHTATLIPDNKNGTVLVCGGYNTAGAAISSCELYFV